MRTPARRQAGPAPRYPVLRPEPARTWWLRPGPYLRFAARELTSVFAATFSVVLLLFLVALSRGPEAYEGFLRWLRLPGVVVASVLALAALVYHALTWFRLSAHILVVRVGRRTVPRPAVNAAFVAAWLVISAVVVALHVRP